MNLLGKISEKYQPREKTPPASVMKCATRTRIRRRSTARNSGGPRQGQPGDLRLCGRDGCVSIEDRSVVPLMESFLWGPQRLVRAQRKTGHASIRAPTAGWLPVGHGRDREAQPVSGLRLLLRAVRIRKVVSRPAAGGRGVACPHARHAAAALPGRPTVFLLSVLCVTRTHRAWRQAPRSTVARLDRAQAHPQPPQTRAGVCA